MKTILRCENLTASYDETKVLQKLSFDVNEGEYLCILGENGSGKSTLVKCLLGIKNPDGGKITFGEGVSRSHIGYLSQNTALRTGFPATVREVVMSGCLGRKGIRPFYSAEDRQRAQKVMERLGIADLANKGCRELSGGQQQKMLLARALCAAEKLLLLDEPVTGLDPAASAEMYRIISELNKKDKMTIIMVSHDIQKAVERADRILCLCSDSCCFFGTPAEYAESHLSKKLIGE